MTQKHEGKVGTAMERIDAISTQIAEHAEESREASPTEARLASLHSQERVQELGGMGVRALTNDPEVEYSRSTSRLDPTQATRARDPHGNEPGRTQNKPMGGVWTAPVSPEADEDFETTRGHAAQSNDESIYTEVRAKPSAVVVVISSEDDLKAMRGAFPPDEKSQPFSYSSARAAGVDAVRARPETYGTAREDGALEGWDVASTVWLSSDNMQVGGTISPGASRCNSCGQWQGEGHSCPASGFTSDPVVRTSAPGMSVSITPGVVDESADFLYKNGQCVALATAIAQDRGWGVAVATYSDEGLVKHAWAVDESGALWDVDGSHDRAAIEEALDEDEEIEVYRPQEVALLAEELEGRIGQQDVPLARTFVPAVLSGEHASDQDFSPSPLDNDDGPDRCQDCGQYASDGHACPKTMTNSAVRGEDGNLMVVHHGSAVAFDSFDPEFTGTGNDTWGSGFYFTTDADTARGYGEHGKSVLLNVTNPIRVDGKEHMSLDGQMYFSAEQSAAILKRHPDIYNQPGDEENPNPLEDYSPEFWDKDDWSKEEIDAMVDSVASDYYDDVQWSSLEATFEGGKSAAFRSAVRDVTGHDGVIADFGEDGTHLVAWFPDQIQVINDGPHSEQQQVERCTECGQYMSEGHNCPGYQSVTLEREAAGWRAGWSADEEQAWDDYGSILHADLNEHLRSGVALDVEERSLTERLDASLESAPRAEESYLTYRGISTLRTNSRGEDSGISASGWVAANAAVGQSITFDGYSSTTLSAETAARFSGSRQEYVKEGVVFEIETTQGGFHGIGPEMEVTLARGTQMEVVSVSEVELDEKVMPVVRMREVDPSADKDASRDEKPTFSHHPLANGPDEAVEFRYLRNPVSSTTHLPVGDTTYGQDIEPAGRYMNEADSDFVPDGWESGTVNFERPLRIEHGENTREWKERLSAHYDGKVGKALSQAVRNDGYDAIITSDKYGTSESIDLTSYSARTSSAASAKGAAPRAPKAGSWDRRRKYTPKDSPAFGKALQERYGEGVEVSLSGGADRDSYVSLSKIMIPKERRGEGLGKKIMADVVAEADRNGWSMSLTPDGEWGSSVTRLRKFYEGFGFVENKGRNKDYRTQGAMIRKSN